MISKNYIQLLKPIFRNKINKINIFILSMLFLLTSIISCYYYTTSNYLNNDIKTGVNYKRIYATTDPKESLTSIRNKLESIEHVVGVFNESSYFNGIQSKTFATKNMDGTVEIYSANNKTIPLIIKGNNFPDENSKYLICPQNFYPNGNETSIKELDSKSKINLEGYIGKKINFIYPDLYKNQIYEMQMTLIGIYENNKTNIDESTCYTTESVLHEIFTNQNKNDETFDESLYRNFYIQVDKIENISKVTKSLEKMGFSYEYVSTINYDYFKSIFSNIRSITIILFTIVIVFILIMKNKHNKENNKYFKMLNYIGYSEAEISKLNLLSLVTMFITSFIISMLFSFIGIFFINKYLELNPFSFNKWNIVYNFNLLYLLVIIILVWSVLETLRNYK